MGHRVLVGTRKGLFTVERSGSSWEIGAVAFAGDNVPMTLADPRDGAVYAALEHGHFGSKLHRSADGGSTWEEVGVPTYPEPASDAVEINPVDGKPITFKLDKVWALEPGGAEEPGVLWCGTIPGGLFRSTDGGRSWSLVHSLWTHPLRKEWFGGGADKPGIHSVCLDPRDSKQLAIGVSCGGVWRSDDAGESWDCRASGMRATYMPPALQGTPHVQDPHRVVRCRTEPDCLWTQHHNGIFRTTDNCASWQEITGDVPSTFGFAVAVHPQSPEVAWFVPGISDEKRIPIDGRLMVTRTRDGGKTFDVLTDGLPQRHAYDITFRHALDVDDQGETLAFGSTTGSLWISEDAGDTWQTVSANLPPIYCVRFTP